MKSIIKKDKGKVKFKTGDLVRSCDQFYTEDFVVLIALISQQGTRFSGQIIWLAETTSARKLGEGCSNYRIKNFNHFEGTLELSQ